MLLNQYNLIGNTLHFLHVQLFGSMSMNQWFRVVAVIAVVLGAAAGALSGALAQDTAPQTYTIQAGAFGSGNIEVLAFAPQNLQVHPGDTVTWVNTGFHNVRFASEPLEFIIAPEVDGQPLPQINPEIALPTIQSGATYSGGEANSGLPGPDVPPEFTLTLDLEPGTYSYLCDVHPGMLGVITVVPPDTPIPSPGETAVQAINEFVGSVQSASARMLEVEAASMEADPTQVSAGVGGTGRATINQFLPFTTTISAGESVTWTNPADSVEPHLVGWPPVRGQDVAPIEVEGGPPVLGLGPTLEMTLPTDSTITPGQAFNSGIILPGQSYTLTFAEPGIYPYTCNIHPGMNGTVVVQ
jgi:plastocyanin